MTLCIVSINLLEKKSQSHKPKLVKVRKFNDDVQQRYKNQISNPNTIKWIDHNRSTDSNNTFNISF